LKTYDQAKYIFMKRLFSQIIFILEMVQKMKTSSHWGRINLAKF